MLVGVLEGVSPLQRVTGLVRIVYSSVAGQGEHRRLRAALFGAALMMLQVVCCCCPIPIAFNAAAAVSGNTAGAELCQRVTCHVPGR
jgi:hypothetical protein